MYAEISNPMDYKVALYIRLSKEDEREGTASRIGESQSITNQRSLLREFVDKKRLYVYNEYIDDGWSGGNFERPAFMRMIEDIEAKKVNMVITKDLSRLGRDYIQTGHYTERYFPENRVRYISLLDGIDTGVDSSMNDITPFKAIMNDMYAKDISKKIKSVKHDKQRKGLFIGGKAPYGYKLSPDQKNMLIIDDEAAAVVHMIFDKALSGESCRQIAVDLNEQNIPPPAVYANLPTSRKGPYSGLWSSERITYILKNLMYVGTMVQGRTKKVNYKSKKSIKVPEEQWVLVEDTHPSIIDKADFDKVQLMINSRKKMRSRTYEYLLKGLIFCKECGYPLGVINRVLSGDRPTLYFVCRTYQRFTKARACTSHCIRVDTVTDMVVAHIKNVCRKYIDKSEFTGIAEAAIEEMKASDNREAKVQGLSNQIANLTANMDKLYTDKLNGFIDDTDFQRLYAKLRADRSAMQEKLDVIQNQSAANVEPSIEIGELIERFIDSAGENRELLCSLVERIELTENKEVHIYFRFHELDEMQGAEEHHLH